MLQRNTRDLPSGEPTSGKLPGVLVLRVRRSDGYLLWAGGTVGGCGDREDNRSRAGELSAGPDSVVHPGAGRGAPARLRGRETGARASVLRAFGARQNDGDSP